MFRSLLLAAVVGSVDAATWLGLADQRTVHRHDLAALVTTVAAWVLTGALTWLTLLVLLAAAEPFAGRELTSYAGCPVGLRPVLLALCGVAAAGALAGPAEAAGPSATGDVPPVSTAGEVLDGLPLPDRPLGAVRRHPPGRVTVTRGDSLWSLARDRLPAGASDAEVTAAWHRLYAANRGRIGPDPDRLAPGLRLRLPDRPIQEDR